MQRRASWRRVAAIVALSVILSSGVGVAQAATSHSDGSPGWIEWVIAQVGQMWKVVSGQVHTDGGENLIDPKG